MYDFNDGNDFAKFKKRLQAVRKSKNYIQDTFAEALHFGSRSSVGNWESTSSEALPSLKDFTTICKLLDVDPNFLLGVSEVDSENDYTISEVIGLSPKNVNQLRNDKDASGFVDHLLSAPELNELLKRMKQICYYEVISEAQETTFMPEALKRIQKAFDSFYRNVFPLDMNVERFAKYVREEFRWLSDRLSIDDFIRSIITENEYNNILFDHPDFESKTVTEKHEILIQDIAETSYDYMMGKPVVELAEQEITKILGIMVRGYVNTEIMKSRSRSQN